MGIGSPILVVSRVLANPDPGLVCFWTLTLLALWRARSGDLGWWLLAGLAAGLALLSKYTAAFLAVTGVLLFVFDERLRLQLKRPGPHLAVLVAAIVFLPVVIWNVQNNFESFRFQTESRFEKGRLELHWLLHLVGGQFGLINPLLAVLLPGAILWQVRQRPRDPRVVVLLAGRLPLLLYLLTQSLWIQVKLNWLVPAYVPLLLRVVVWWSEAPASRWGRRIKTWAWHSMVWLQIVSLLAPLIRALPPPSGTSWSGWQEIAARAKYWEDIVEAEDGIEDNMFFFGADYRDSAQLGRCLAMLLPDTHHHGKVLGHVGADEDVMAQNVVGLPALQFDHWGSPAAHVGQNAIFVLPRPQDRGEILRLVTAQLRQRRDGRTPADPSTRCARLRHRHLCLPRLPRSSEGLRGCGSHREHVHGFHAASILTAVR